MAPSQTGEASSAPAKGLSSCLYLDNDVAGCSGMRPATIFSGHFSDLPNPACVEFRNLCEIAYDGVMKQELVYPHLGKSFNHLGFMHSSNKVFCPRGYSHSYSILYISIQEYLAAVHVYSKIKPDQQMQLFRNCGKHDHLHNSQNGGTGSTSFHPKCIDLEPVEWPTGAIPSHEGILLAQLPDHPAKAPPLVS